MTVASAVPPAASWPAAARRRRRFDAVTTNVGGDVAGLAGGPPAQPDGPGPRRRRVDPAPQLRRDRQVEAVARARPGPRRAPRRPAARAQRDAARRRATRRGTRRRRSTTTSMATVRGALGELIRAHDPYPAVVVDRRLGRRDVQHRRPGVPRRRRRAPARSRRSTRTASRCTPRGWRRASRTSPSGPTTSSARSTARSRSTRDPRLRDLLDEVSAYPNVAAPRRVVAHARRHPGRRRAAAAAASATRVQSWFSTNTSIGTPVDITLDELHVELFHPADEATAAMVGGRTAYASADRRSPRIASARRWTSRSRRPRPTRRRRRSPPRSRSLWPRPAADGRRRRPAAAGVAVQRALVEPADPAAPGPALGLTARRPWPSS